MFFELDKAGDLLRFYREYIKDAPEQFGGFPAFQIAPPLPFIPEDRHGDRFASIVACWAGDLDEGERVLEPFHDGAGGGRDGRADALPGAQQRVRRAVPAGLRHYWKGNFVKELTDDAIAAHVEHGPGARADHHDAHLPDQRRLPPGGARRHGFRLPRRQLRQ